MCGLCLASVVSAQAAGAALIYVAPNEGFEVDLAAAVTKKDVAATVVMNEAEAQYVLVSTPLSINRESDIGKWVRCEFALCMGIADSGTVSVQLVKKDCNRVVWAYQVNKQRAIKNRQSMAEAIAKHLQKEYFAW